MLHILNKYVAQYEYLSTVDFQLCYINISTEPDDRDSSYYKPLQI